VQATALEAHIKINRIMLSARSLLYVVALGVSLLPGCTTPKEHTVTFNELNNLLKGPNGKYSDLWRGIYYRGTSDQYHHLLVRYDLRKDLPLKIKTNELSIEGVAEFPLSKGDWREMSHLLDRTENAK
jgi:hypothetical protein